MCLHEWVKEKGFVRLDEGKGYVGVFNNVDYTVFDCMLNNIAHSEQQKKKQIMAGVKIKCNCQPPTT